MEKGRKKLVAAVHAEFERVRKEVEPKLLTVGQAPEFQNEEIRNIQYAQNVLRTCLEAILFKMLPYSERVLIELALRTASYALSAAPMEDQDQLVSALVRVFADAHQRRMALGIRIDSEWQMKDGREVPNFPE
jgi:hypothetical protein